MEWLTWAFVFLVLILLVAIILSSVLIFAWLDQNAGVFWKLKKKNSEESAVAQVHSRFRVAELELELGKKLEAKRNLLNPPPAPPPK